MHGWGGRYNLLGRRAGGQTTHNDQIFPCCGSLHEIVKPLIIRTCPISAINLLFPLSRLFSKLLMLLMTIMMNTSTIVKPTLENTIQEIPGCTLAAERISIMGLPRRRPSYQLARTSSPRCAVCERTLGDTRRAKRLVLSRTCCLVLQQLD
ncbi:uncharacterized protein K489DRAFT_159024 [Dissoconium aciculare CBS 342.82]|uniref:Uncharacterized protein n=1 Tax=Dissoconium aciculare CBS 342.82 TaxID=1314786 RepID=A0A6J3MC78_9PEZI|nr:uncharacterized protein K489DRAFT_159024 [Dissoconium aciculare CBS 342.82]KAF1825488.1 hypothetical protein K489DRAFT_159024 [Dissoconium aciculare CBS 342.82]